MSTDGDVADAEGRNYFVEALEDLASVRAQLAAVTRERDEARNDAATWVGELTVALVAVTAERDRLRAALEPTSELLQVIRDHQRSHCTHLPRGSVPYGAACFNCAITAIRARAGLP